jgi:hypothetical protein
MKREGDSGTMVTTQKNNQQARLFQSYIKQCENIVYGSTTNNEHKTLKCFLKIIPSAGATGYPLAGVPVITDLNNVSALR